MSLILLGGIEWNDPVLAQALDQVGVGQLTLIPAATAYGNYTERIARARSYFEQAGIAVDVADIFTRRDANDDTLVGQVAKSACPYIMDGSALHLRSVMWKSKLFEALTKASESGATLVASGAGASVLGDPMVDPRGGAYTVGLGIIKHVAVFPHMNTAPAHLAGRSKDLLSSHALLVGIDEATGLVRRDGRWEVVGAGQVAVFAAGAEAKRYSAGDTVDLGSG